MLFLKIFFVGFALLPIAMISGGIKTYMAQQKLHEHIEIYLHDGRYFAYKFTQGRSCLIQFPGLESLQIVDGDDFSVLKFLDTAGIPIEDIEDWSGTWDWDRMQKTLGLKSGAKK